MNFQSIHLFFYFYVKTSVQGLSGEVKFDYQGLRTDINMEIIELTTAGITNIGNWKTNSGLNIQRKHSSGAIDMDTRSLVNKSFIVMTALVRKRNKLLRVVI